MCNCSHHADSPRTLDDVMNSLSPARSAKVEALAAQLVAAEKERRQRRFSYEGELYEAESAPFMGSDIVLELPGRKFLEPSSWIHGDILRIGFAHVFPEPRQNTTVVKVHAFK